MHFTPELNGFQGALISASNIHDFSKITARGGNEDNIKNIINHLHTYFAEKAITTGNEGKNDPIARELAFYIVLNGDFCVLEQLIELPGLESFIWTTPTISKCLLSEMMWSLKMDDYIYEQISLCSPSFSLEILEAFIDSVKYFSPTECINKIKILAAACYRLIGRFNYYNYEENYVTTCLSDAYELLLRIITYFIEPPRQYLLDNYIESDKHKYIGNNLSAMIKLILECLEMYVASDTYSPDGFEDLYLLTIDPERIQTNTLSYTWNESPKNHVQECLDKCNKALVERCTELVMDVSLEIYCSWCEYEENDKTMQQSVGELCYTLQSKLVSITELSECRIVNMLTEISCKPQDISDILKSSNLSLIIENINNDIDDKSLWIQELIQRDDVFKNQEIVEVMLENLKFINEDSQHELLEIIFNDFEGQFSKLEFSKELYLKVFDKQDINYKQDIIAKHFDFGLNDLFEFVGTDSMITEVFNKLIATSNLNLSEVLSVFIQNPRKTYTKIINSAVESKSVHVRDVMIKILIFLDAYNMSGFEPDTSCLVGIINDFAIDLTIDTQRNNFTNLMIEMIQANILPKSVMFRDVTMKNLDHGLISKDVYLIHIFVQVLASSFSDSDLSGQLVPLLGMLAQIMHSIRWEPKTFASIAATALDATIALQQKVMKLLNDEPIPERSVQWLKSKAKNLSYINMYHFRTLLKIEGNFLETVCGKDVKDEQLLVVLCKILSVTTQEEWTELWDCIAERGSVKALILFNKALCIMSIELSAYLHGKNTVNCLLYCFTNYVHIIKNKFLKEPIGDIQVALVLQNISILLNVQKESVIDDVDNTLLPLLCYLAERKADYEYDVSPICEKLRYNESKKLVSELFALEIAA